MSQTESFDHLACQDRNLGDQKQKKNHISGLLKGLVLGISYTCLSERNAGLLDSHRELCGKNEICLFSSANKSKNNFGITHCACSVTSLEQIGDKNKL